MKIPNALAGALVTVAALAALVYLLAHGQDVTPVLTLVAPVLAALGLSAKLDGHGQTLGTISENVNGKLDKRIKDAVTAVLDERGETPAA